MASIQLEHTTVIPTFSWKESTCTTMKLQVENMYQEQFLSIWNPVRWIPSDPDHLDRSLGPTTSFSVRVVLETTGRKDITLKELNW
mmetsp:Transcript_3358/g.5684  ORF Transcript_3358/g.5684 Transcript_3358/m.5684 type:complete len:86 (+) Transcript_3358:141-398(+)